MRLGELIRFVGFYPPGCFFFKMHLLYLDDSGSVPNKQEEYFVLGGISVYESQAHFITSELDKLAEDINPQDPDSVEFHASTIYSRRENPLKSMSVDEAKGVIKAVLKIFADTYETGLAFACAIEKSAYTNEDPVHMAFEELCNRFDRYLSKLKTEGERQRGLIILISLHQNSIKPME